MEMTLYTHSGVQFQPIFWRLNKCDLISYEGQLVENTPRVPASSRHLQEEIKEQFMKKNNKMVKNKENSKT